MANYSKIKRGKLTQSCITTTVEGNWVLERWDDIEEVVNRIRKLEKEAEGRINKNNTLESKTTQDHHLFLLPSKRLKNCLSCKGGFLE